MARVCLVPPAPVTSGFDHMMEDYRLLVRSAERSEGDHRLVKRPEEADVVLFVGSRDPLQRDVRRHAIARKWPRRIVLYDSNDRIIPFLRGIYPSIERRHYRLRRMRGGHYLRWSESPSIRFTDPERAPTHLFGFTGAACTHPLRAEILRLRHPGALLRDSTNDPGRGFGQPAAVYEEYRERYGQELAAVRFVLCPRGAGTSSMRIFEAMKAGRVPVILSDEWVEPEGPEWNRFSIRVTERDVASLPALLELRRDEAISMGGVARTVWETWFSPEASFPTFAAVAEKLVNGSWALEQTDRVLTRRGLLRWGVLRQHILGPAARRLSRWSVA